MQSCKCYIYNINNVIKRHLRSLEIQFHDHQFTHYLTKIDFIDMTTHDSNEMTGPPKHIFQIMSHLKRK